MEVVIEMLGCIAVVLAYGYVHRKEIYGTTDDPQA